METRHGFVYVPPASKNVVDQEGKLYDTILLCSLNIIIFLLNRELEGKINESRDDQSKIECLVENLSRQLMD